MVKELGKAWRVLKVPLALTLYGFLIVALQPLLIKLFALRSLSSSLVRNVVEVSLYLLINAALFYSWYLITKRLRNSAIRRAQSYSGSSRSDRPS